MLACLRSFNRETKEREREKQTEGDLRVKHKAIINPDSCETNCLCSVAHHDVVHVLVSGFKSCLCLGETQPRLFHVRNETLETVLFIQTHRISSTTCS